jgi:hypothetical protein
VLRYGQVALFIILYIVRIDELSATKHFVYKKLTPVATLLKRQVSVSDMTISATAI